MRTILGDYLSVFEHIRSNFTHVAEGDSTAALEWSLRGLMVNLELPGYQCLEISNDQVQRFRTYYDSAVFLPLGKKAPLVSS